ncbi:MAG: hypothetical protein ACRETY_02595 [Steroidobacteraceae bacterium]
MKPGAATTAALLLFAACGLPTDPATRLAADLQDGADRLGVSGVR